MNKGMLFLLIIFILFGFACKRNFDECESGYSKSTESLDSSLGIIDFSYNSNFWVNRDTLSNPFVLVNDNGYKVNYQYKYHTISDFGTKKVSSYKAPTEMPCGNRVFHYSYFTLRKEQFEYRASNSPFRINYSRTVDIKSYHVDSIPMLKGIEEVAIQLYHENNYQYNLKFQVVFDSTNVLPFQTYQDSLVLRNKSFQKVYTAMVDTSKIDHGFIQPIGIYFNKEKGFIGYFLNNGEKWVIE